jgi:hypothetical protein
LTARVAGQHCGILPSPSPPHKRHKSRAHDSDVTFASRINFRLQTRHLFAAPSSIEPSLTLGESFSGRTVSLKLVSHETGIVSSTTASSTPLLVSGQGLTTASDNTPQDAARTAVHTLSVFYIASHSATLSALFTSASASVLPYVQCRYCQSMCKFLARHPHTFISVERSLLLLLLLLLRRRITINSAPSCAMDIQKFRILSYRRMGLEAAALLAALPNFSTSFFLLRR